HRGSLEEGQLPRLKTVETACEKGVERRRQRLGPASLVRVCEQLLDEERVAAGRAKYLLPELLRNLAQVLEQGLAVVARKRSECRRIGLAPSRSLLEQLGTGEAEQEDRRPGCRQVIDQFE